MSSAAQLLNPPDSVFSASPLLRLTLASLLVTEVCSAQVIINEIHCDPADNTKAIEFVELHNPTAQPVDVSGWRLEDGVTFSFPAGTNIPAGGFFVVAQNATAFQTQFGVAPGGVFTGLLSNRGEQLQLRDANAALIDEVTYAVGFPWPTAAKGGGRSMELIHPALDNDLGGSWRASTPVNGTPGAQNSIFAANAPPAIRQVEHIPVQPPANVPVTITAKVTDPDGVASVSLETQLVNPGSYIRKTDPAFATSWTAIPMQDDGLSGDVVAADGTFTAVIPATDQIHRRLVRYRITVTDSLGANVRVPYPDDEQPNFAYFVYNGTPAWSGAVLPGNAGPRGVVQTFPPALLNTIQTWHLLANPTDVTNSQYASGSNGVRFPGTVVYEGKVYDHISYRNRGIGSTYVSGKNKWSLHFNRTRDVRVRDNWGNYYREDWNSFPIDACSSPWAAVHRGMAGIEEAFTYRLYELAGMASLRTHYIHWRVIDAANESGPAQYDGDLWGLYIGLEPTEANFLDERSLPDGNLYAIEGTNGDKKHQGPTQPLNTSDWTTFRNAAVQAGQTEQWYRDNIDLDTFYTFAALNRFCGNVDVRGGDNYRYYHRPTDNRWLIIPYDLDMMAIPAHHWGTSVDGVTYAGVPDQIRAITRHPAIAIEFRNRARELLDLLGTDSATNGGQVGQLIDEYAQMVNPTGAAQTWADVDEALWCNHPRTAGGGGASGQTSHKNNFYRTPYADTRGGLNGTSSTSWTRTLPDPISGYSNFEGSLAYLLGYTTNIWPGGTWVRSNGNPRGYGFKYLEWESLYGGLGINPSTPDLSFPNTPTIAYAGAADFAANALDFTSGDFAASATGGTTFAAMQWRIGEIRAPGVAGYVAGQPRKYEVEQVWTSPEITTFTASVRVPVSVVEPGHTYRARVRHKDANRRWSHWSAPVQFVAASSSVAVYQQSLVISEIMYHPAPVKPAEFAAGYSDEDFEYIELRNVSSMTVDLTDVRFTKGVDFDFPAGYTLAAGASCLIVKNVAAFTMRYGAGKPVAGTYGSDSLNNSTEEIKLSYGVGTSIRGFTYADTAPWPLGADGGGSSLVRRFPENLALDDNAGSNWRASVASGGSPGGDDRTTFTAWAASHGVTEATADLEKDGLSNLLEYALSGDPSEISLESLPRMAVQTDVAGGVPAQYLTLTFRRLNTAEDISYHAEFSTTLAEWNLAGVLMSSTDNGDGTSTEVWRAPNPISVDEELFGRVRVVMP